MASPTKEIVKSIAERLTALGFQKSKAGILTRLEAPDILFWVGTNLAKRGHAVEVNPVVGVRHQAIERLVADLRREPFDEVVPPTAAANVGYFTDSDSYQAFLFQPTQPIGAVLTQLIDAIAGPGLSFVKANETLENLTVTLKTARWLIPWQAAYRLPVAQLLLGHRTEAAETLAAASPKFGGEDPASVQFRAFAERLRERL